MMVEKELCEDIVKFDNLRAGRNVDQNIIFGYSLVVYWIYNEPQFGKIMKLN